MKTTVVFNNRPTLLGTSTGFRLMPGANNVPSDELDKFVNDETFKGWRKLGWVKVKPAAGRRGEEDTEEEYEDLPVLPDAEPSSPDNPLAAQSVEDARHAIEATEDRDDLLKWHEMDKRIPVKKAIEKRLKALG